MFAQFGQNGNFPQKYGSITFLPLWTCEWYRLISYNMEHISEHFQPKLITGS